MWSIVSHEDVAKRYKKYKKKWPHELNNVFDNLDTLFEALCSGVRSEQLKKMGFVHSEPLGVLGIDQKGPGKGTRLKQFRLYVYPDEETETLQVRILGDKSRQSDDINVSTRFVQKLIEQRAEGYAEDAGAG